MLVNSISNSPVFQARIKINKKSIGKIVNNDYSQFTTSYSGALSSAGTASSAFAECSTLPEPDKLYESSLLTGSLGSLGSAYKLLEKASKISEKTDKKIPS